MGSVLSYSGISTKIRAMSSHLVTDEQLQEIVRYIAEDLQEPATAERMLDSMEKEIMSLSTLPNRVALTTEEPWHSAGIHKMPVKNYLVYFWVDEPSKKVQITAIVYGRRDQRSVLQNMKM